MATIKRNWALVGMVALSITTAAHAALLEGQSIGVDFANGPNTPGAGAEVNFNILTDVGVYENIINTSGAVVSGVTIHLKQSRGSMGENNLGFGGANIGDYTGTPFSDLSFNDGIWNTGSIEVTISGLNNNLAYDILAICAGPVTQDRAVTVTIGDAQLSRTYNEFRANNVLSPLSFTSITTDGEGNVTIRFSVETSAVALNAIHITAVPMPEPTSLALMGLGGLVIFRRRRAC